MAHTQGAVAGLPGGLATFKKAVFVAFGHVLASGIVAWISWPHGSVPGVMYTRGLAAGRIAGLIGESENDWVEGYEDGEAATHWTAKTPSVTLLVPP
jgi:hypothetical protein